MPDSPVVTADTDTDGCARWIVVLPTGVRVTIDDRSAQDSTVDIWVDDPFCDRTSIVAIGDTPADGFATYTL
jgi:hypothetical protein